MNMCVMVVLVVAKQGELSTVMDEAYPLQSFSISQSRISTETVREKERESRCL